jgi:flagellar biogenesis protein FliO|tara:strand:- start:40 stop:324 length:285 start_codon:yes stop_codon:yes gene_type:complete
MDKNEEILKMIDQANNNVWFPVTLVGSILGALLLVLLAYWKLTQVINNNRHAESEKIIEELSHNATAQTAINTRLETLVVRNLDDIKELKQDMK